MTAEEYVESVMHRKYIPHNYLDKQLKKAFEEGQKNIRWETYKLEPVLMSDGIIWQQNDKNN